jgi:deoxyribonuclease-1
MILALLLSFASFAGPIGSFDQAKKYLTHHMDLFESKTIYCGCKVENKRVNLESCGYKIHKDAKRASRMEWEHVVPAEAFGKSFVEWREGAAECVKKNGKRYKGRQCAGKNSEFAKMEGDLYNLFPEIGELNGLRSNYSMAQLPGPTGRFGNCNVKLESRKFEPSDDAKGVVARTYLNMDRRYPGRGIVSEKNRPLFESWDRLYAVSDLECTRWKALEPTAGYPHLFSDRCPIRGPARAKK